MSDRTLTGWIGISNPRLSREQATIELNELGISLAHWNEADRAWEACEVPSSALDALDALDDRWATGYIWHLT